MSYTTLNYWEVVPRTIWVTGHSQDFRKPRDGLRMMSRMLIPVGTFTFIRGVQMSQQTPMEEALSLAVAAQQDLQNLVATGEDGWTTESVAIGVTLANHLGQLQAIITGSLGHTGGHHND